jgi:hypothetical protein
VALLAVLFTLSFALPYADQMTLANSLIVGRKEDLELWICKVCDDSNRPLHAHYVEDTKTHIKSIISVYNEFVVLAFRYTATALNVWQDLLFVRQRADEHTCKKCRVQAEYNRMWGKIQNTVTNDLIDIKRQTGLEKLYITGISLGGALAALSYIDIKYTNIFEDVRVVTYGAPRVGNKKWAKFFDGLTNGQSRRYIVKGDPIVVLPPSCLTPLCSYRQTGIKIVCKEKQKLCVQEKHTDDELTELAEHFTDVDSDMKDLEGIMAHVNGYPKIYNFTLEFKK